MLEEIGIGQVILIGAGCVAGGALIVGIIAAVARFIKRAQAEGEKVESIYTDELTMGEIKNWFSGKLSRETLKGMILCPTPENIAKWNLDIDKSELDNMLIQAVYDEEKDEITAYREVIFGTLSPKLKELLDTNGGAIVIES